ncbi:MAG: hypothetical protein JNN26_05695 [Candidatus Obscuribacter sp.]|nr:hypothetical protein [Candidatus Obscuribacter sp.]
MTTKRLATIIFILSLPFATFGQEASARRAYSSYGDVDEKVLDEILHGKKPAAQKKTTRPRSKSKPNQAPNTTGGAITIAPIEASASNGRRNSGRTTPTASGPGEAQRKSLLSKLSPVPEMAPPTSLDMVKARQTKHQ